MNKTILFLYIFLGYASVSQANSPQKEDKEENNVEKTIESPTLNTSMRFHLDYAAHKEDYRDLGDGFSMRRAWIGINGELNPNWNYQFLFSFSESGQVSPILLYLQYTGWDYGNITIGQVKQAYGLEWLTSSNNLTMLERSLPVAAFSSSFRTGLIYNINRDRWTMTLMAYGKNTGAETRTSQGDEGLGLGGRFTFLPVYAENSFIHFGIAAHTEEPQDKNVNNIRFTTRPESMPSTLRLVDTEQISDVKSINRLGIEAALVKGPLSFQSEWMYVNTKRGSGVNDVDFSGWYVTGSYFITGESRGYRNGVFRGVSPKGNYGAVEVTARYSTISLDNGDIFGGKQNNVALGLNWYVNDKVRFMFNYINVRSKKGAISDNPDIFLVRAQMVL